MAEPRVAGLSPREERDLILEVAAQLIAKGWTKGTSARDVNGSPASFDSPDACEFCLGGAIWRATVDHDVSPLAANWAETAVRNVLKCSVVIFNDKIAQNAQEVIGALRQAKEQGL